MFISKIKIQCESKKVFISEQCQQTVVAIYIGKNEKQILKIHILLRYFTPVMSGTLPHRMISAPTSSGSPEFTVTIQ